MELMQKKNLVNAVERVLHVKGNYSGGILEMTLVVDCGLPEEYVRGMTADIAFVLRSHSEVFRNVRMNLLYWMSEEKMENRVVPFSFLQMSKCFEDYEEQEKEMEIGRDEDGGPVMGMGTVRVPQPFDVSRCTLYLWGMEE